MLWDFSTWESSCLYTSDLTQRPVVMPSHARFMDSLHFLHESTTQHTDEQSDSLAMSAKETLAAAPRGVIVTRQRSSLGENFPRYWAIEATIPSKT